MSTKTLFICLIFVFFSCLNAGKINYNSQIASPYGGIQLGDPSGDGVTDFIILSSDKIYITSTEFTVHGYSYSKLPTPASRLITGYFDGVNTREIICAQEPAYSRLDCYIMAPTIDGLWWYWYQGDFIGTNQAIVGDFDGDGRDDILVYTPSTGAFQMYIWNPSTWFFQVKTNWYPGNINPSPPLINCQIRAGKFDTDARTDLLVYNPSGGWIAVYGSAIDGNSQYTFWWAFSTASNWVSSTEELSLADIDGDGTDDLVLHTTTGAYYFYKVQYNSIYSMTPLYNSVGQLNAAANCHLYWGKLKNPPAPASEDSGRSNIRHDALVFCPSSAMWIRSDARFDGTQQTYWWVYSQYALNLNADQDGDAIETKHELGGYDVNNDGVSDTPLHTYGASPFYKDVFVQADYMAGPPGSNYNFAMMPTAVSLAVSSFAAKSLNLHIFVGSQVPYEANLGEPDLDWVRDFDPIKNIYFPAARVPFFHYCLFANEYSNSGSSGIARGIPAQDFIVSLGGVYNSLNWQTGTFLHELGHTLGLHHGGPDDVNYKPNDLSIMNYLYQVSGIYENSAYQYFYSDTTCSNLNEAYLVETSGVPCAANPYWTEVDSSGIWTPVNTAFDFNRNGVYDYAYVDLNLDGAVNTLQGGINEYNALVFNGGSIGSATKRSEVSVSEDALHEPPREQIRQPPADHSIDTSQLKPHNGTQFLQTTGRNYPEDLALDTVVTFKVVNVTQQLHDRLNQQTGDPQLNQNTDIVSHADKNHDISF